MRSFGTGSYFPRVYDFFPRLARGHGTMTRHEMFVTLDGKSHKGARSNEPCLAASCDLRNGKGEKHHDQAQNRKEWEESVGVRTTSRKTHRAQAGFKTAATTAIDPKDLTSKI